MRILLTGGSGFVGSRLATQAIAAGHQVLTFSRSQATLEEGVQHLRASISQPPWREIERFRPDLLVHTAWETTPGVYLDSPENRQWLHWSQVLIQGLVHRGTHRFLTLGTCIECQMTGLPLGEDAPTDPKSTYARSKDELRQWLAETFSKEPERWTWVRLFYPYGPGEHPSRLCSSLINRLCRGESLELKTPHSVKDYIYVDDVVSALISILQSNQSGIFHLGTGQGATVLELAQKIGSLLGKSDLIRWSNPPAVDPFAHVVAKPTRLKSLGWFPQVRLDEGLGRLIQACTP